MSKKTPRQSLSSRIQALELPKAAQYARFIREGEGGPVPCWGAITTRFVESFGKDEERLELLQALFAEGDRRPLWLFLETCRDRPEVLKVLCRRVDELPVEVQRSLVSLPEAERYVQSSLAKLAPAARQVWEGGLEVQRAELELFVSRVGELMSFQYYVLDEFEPSEEGEFVGAQKPELEPRPGFDVGPVIRPTPGLIKGDPRT